MILQNNFSFGVGWYSKGTHSPAFPACFLSLYDMLVSLFHVHIPSAQPLTAQAAISSHLTAEVERPASAIMMHKADESFAESGSIYSNSTIKATPSALGHGVTLALSQPACLPHLSIATPNHLQLKRKDPRNGEIMTTCVHGVQQ